MECPNCGDDPGTRAWIVSASRGKLSKAVEERFFLDHDEAIGVAMKLSKDLAPALFHAEPVVVLFR